VILERIYENTMEFIKNIDKSQRKKIGQFFTSISVARYMAGLMAISKKKVRLMDAGAGSGILIGALCDEILKNKNIKEIEIDLYENDSTILPLLRENMDYIKDIFNNSDKKLSYHIIEENYILNNEKHWKDEIVLEEEQLYDVIISNPPYKKLRKSEVESVTMKSIVHGQPNIYFLFMAMSAKLLKKDGEMIFITPRSFTSGAYFREFRKWFFNNVKITNLHLFISRSDVFDTDTVLQETIITRAVKTFKENKNIVVTESEDMRIEGFVTKHEVPYKTIIDTNSDNYFMLIPTNERDLEIMNFLGNWSNNLITLGYRLKTGTVVDFRSTEFLKYENDYNTVPLFWAYNFNSYRINFPIYKEDKPQYIISNKDSQNILLENKDYIFVKRFTSKEESRRIQAIIYFSNDFDCKVIGVENHLNYITKEKGNFTQEELFGIFTVLNTTFIDIYYRILNGSTQVNATEMNSLPMPSKKEIIEIGKMAMIEDYLSVEVCDNLVLKVCKSTNFRKVI
jgi:adenine-specific DNA-methyltransferase